MNIEIANRLMELRKEHGYSQEQLAEKLGISRQAVSKWERAESSPDTDNLICLAKLYNISLDELLQLNDVESSNTKNDEKEVKKAQSGSSVKITPTRVYINDENDEIDISLTGIKIKENESENDYDLRFEFEEKKIVSKINGALVFIVVIAYILMGSFADLWHPGWIIFVSLPLMCTVVEAIAYKDINKFAFPLLVVVVYLILGCGFNLWHPWWVLFITIPLYYEVINIFRKKKQNDKDDD